MNIVAHGQKIQYAMCSKKFRYRDQYDADVSKAVLIADTPNVRRPELLVSYSCPYCDGWHIGHNREPK